MSAEDKRKRMSSIGGSDAKIIMGDDEQAIIQLWLEKRGEAEPENLDEVVLVQLGNVTESLNFDLFEHHTGLWVTDEQQKVFHPDFPFLHGTLDGKVRQTLEGPVLGIMDAKFMLPFNDWTIEGALEKHWAQLQHNMACTGTERAWLSVIKATGGYAYIECEADFFFQVSMIEAEKRFWECVQTGETPTLAGVERTNAPKPAQVVVYDMSDKNEWAVHAQRIVETLLQSEIHDLSKKKLKELMPEDAAIAKGHGVTLKLSSNNRVLFEIDGSKEVKKQAKVAVEGEETAKPKRSRAKKQPEPALAA